MNTHKLVFLLQREKGRRKGRKEGRKEAKHAAYIHTSMHACKSTFRTTFHHVKLQYIALHCQREKRHQPTSPSKQDPPNVNAAQCCDAGWAAESLIPVDLFRDLFRALCDCV